MKRLQTVGLVVTVLLVAVLVGSAVTGFFRSEPAPEAPVDEPQVDGGRIRVEVLNGAGVPGLARDVTRLLRQRNFDVVYYGNAPAARDSSVVIDRVGRTEDAQRVADALGIARVRSEPDTTLYLEASVVLGRDWRVGEGTGPDEEEPTTAP